MGERVARHFLMSSVKEIHYIKHAQIDFDKWNQCIDGALNCRIYAYDWHLDRTAIEWDALVYGDYEYVMPLPFRKKMGIKYLCQPLFSQQLGIFPTPSKTIFNAFIAVLKNRFRYADIQLNALNIPGENNGDIFFEQKNYLLSLTKDFKSIISGYSKNTKRNIAKAQKQDLSIIEGIRLEDFLEFKAKNLPPGVDNSTIDKLKSLIAFGEYKGFGKIYGVYTPGNDLCAAVYFCRWKDRVIYFNAASNKEGKNTGAMYYLINRFIEDNAEKNLILDFEGPIIPGVEHFYKGFGAKTETYFQLRYNRLPLLLRWLKR